MRGDRSGVEADKAKVSKAVTARKAGPRSKPKLKESKFRMVSIARSSLVSCVRAPVHLRLRCLACHRHRGLACFPYSDSLGSLPLALLKEEETAAAKKGRGRKRHTFVQFAIQSKLLTLFAAELSRNFACSFTGLPTTLLFAANGENFGIEGRKAKKKKIRENLLCGGSCGDTNKTHADSAGPPSQARMEGGKEGRWRQPPSPQPPPSPHLNHTGCLCECVRTMTQCSPSSDPSPPHPV